MALRKKFCLKLPAIFADEYDNRGIRDYNGESLAGAAHTEFGEDGYDIMVIDLFRDGELVGRYFADKVTSEHKGWDVKAKRWYQKIRLDNLAAAVLSLPTGYSHDDWRDDPYSLRGADHEKIHDFFGYSISAWENDAESKLYTRRINRHEELTRQWVAKWYVDPDEAFRDWAVSLVRIPAAIGRKIDGEVQYACTCCGKRWTRKKFYRSGHKVECPECGAKLKPVRESTANVAWTTEVRVYRAAPGKDGKGWFLEMLYSFGRFDIEEGTWSFRLSPHIMTHLEQGEHYDVVVNIQGDEPFVEEGQIAALIDCFRGEGTDIATLRTPIRTVDELLSPNNVKVVCDCSGRALYFSRQPIPYRRDVEQDRWLDGMAYYKHVGVYAFRSEVLERLCKLAPATLEECEKLEQLRWMSNGYTIAVRDTEHANIGIDTPADLAEAEAWLARHK